MASNCGTFLGQTHQKSTIFPTITLSKFREVMGFRLPGIVNAKQILQRMRMGAEVKYAPKGYFAVYVGQDQKKRFVVPVSFLKNSAFQNLLSKAEEEFGFDHPRGGFTIPCTEEAFIDATSGLNC